MLIDPNTWSKNSSVALAELATSADGALLAFVAWEQGSDLRTIIVLAWRKWRVMFYPKPDSLVMPSISTLSEPIKPKTRSSTKALTNRQRSTLFLAVQEGGSFLFTLAMTRQTGRPVSPFVPMTNRHCPPPVDCDDGLWSVVANLGTKQFLSTAQDAPVGKSVSSLGADLRIPALAR